MNLVTVTHRPSCINSSAQPPERQDPHVVDERRLSQSCRSVRLHNSVNHCIVNTQLLCGPWGQCHSSSTASPPAGVACRLEGVAFSACCLETQRAKPLPTGHEQQGQLSCLPLWHSLPPLPPGAKIKEEKWANLKLYKRRCCLRYHFHLRLDICRLLYPGANFRV